MKAILGSVLCLLACLHPSCADVIWDESRFVLSAVARNFSDAAEACVDEGGRLAEVVNMALQRELYEYAMAQNFEEWGIWIGGNDMEVEGIFRWIRSGLQVPYTGWQCGQPDDRKNNQDCLVIARKYRGKFDDSICSNLFKYFCEFETTAGADQLGTTVTGAEDIDECVNIDCENGGVCVDGVGTYTCDCISGYTGNLCETDIDECANIDCQNSGVCVDGVGTFTCECMVGYTGDLCETDIDECAEIDCKNGGVCVDDVGTYICECVSGYTGDLCETGECDCQNGGTCVAEAGTYKCNCNSGYIGEFCEIVCNRVVLDKCYVSFDVFATWDSSVQYCNTRGGILAEICNNEINEALQSLAEDVGRTSWIGATPTGGQWHWATNSCNFSSYNKLSSTDRDVDSRLTIRWYSNTWWIFDYLNNMPFICQFDI